MLMTKLSKLSPELMQDFLELGKELNLEITTQDPIIFFNLQDIKDRKTRKRAEKLLKKAEQEVAALSAMRLQHGSETPGTMVAQRTERLRSQSLPSVMAESTTIMRMGSIETSRERLLEGNRRFVEERTRLAAKDEKVDKYDAIVVMCSDARCEMADTRMFADKKVLMLQVAGNVASVEVKDALSKLKDGGEVIVCGHDDCGACKAKRDAPQTRTGLLGKVDIVGQGPNIFWANASNQAEAIDSLSIIRTKKAKVISAIFDPMAREPLRTLESGAPKSEIFDALRESAKDKVARAMVEGKDLKTQTAHTIIVGDQTDLGRFGMRNIFDAGPNELFCVSSYRGKLSEEALGSIEYALAHVKGITEDPNLVVIHTDKDEAKSIESLLQKRLGKGVRISVMVYDRDSGEAKLAA